MRRRDLLEDVVEDEGVGCREQFHAITRRDCPLGPEKVAIANLAVRAPVEPYMVAVRVNGPHILDPAVVAIAEGNAGKSRGAGMVNRQVLDPILDRGFGDTAPPPDPGRLAGAPVGHV